MSLFSPAVGQAAALLPPSLSSMPPSLAVVSSSSALVIVAGGGRDLTWPVPLIARELLARADGHPVHLLLHGGARGTDQGIAAAADQLGWPSQALPADWRRFGRGAGPIRNRQLLDLALANALSHSKPRRLVCVLVVAFPGGAGTASLVQIAHQRAALSSVPVLVMEVAPASGPAGLPA
jgi:hypothetical protein